MTTIVAGSIPTQEIPELAQTKQHLTDEFGARFVSKDEASLLEAASANRDVRALVIPWTPDPLVTEAVLEKLPKLEIIVSTYGGVKRNVAVDAALARGIRLTCTGAVRARSVAEFTLALMMDGLLYVSRTHHDMRSGQRFPRYGYSRELTERTVGVVGFGSVTKELLTLIAPFRTTTLIHSAHASDAELSKWNSQSVTLEDLARRSEVVVLLTGLTEKTRGMIDAGFLKQMRENALLVNTARGKLIDEAALAGELQTGRIRAALDVYEEEPLALDSPLRGFDNVTLTAHSANSTREMDSGRWVFALSELRLFAAGKALTGELDADHIARMSDD